MDAKEIERIVDAWHLEYFTFIDQDAQAELVRRLVSKWHEDGLGYRPCPHGAKRIDCGHCDHMEDMNFDAARERGRR